MNWTTLHVDDPTGSKCTMGSTASGEAGCQPSFDGPLAKNARQQCPRQAKLRAQPSSLSTCVSGTASPNDTGTGQAGPKRERLRVSQDTRERTGIGGYSSDRSSAHNNPADSAALQCTEDE